jgi:hypothetical protein
VTLTQEEPLAGKRLVCVTERKTRTDWTVFLEEIAARYEHAERITLVMDNLNTHTPGSLYEAFLPSKTKEIWVYSHAQAWKPAQHGRNRT